jgi:DNA-binding response OmpR family regulator
MKARKMTDTNVDDAERSTMLLTGKDALAAPHILIAEHQPAIQDLLRWILQLAGYRTTMCVDRHAALTWREQALPGDDPALILLDLSLLCASEAADFLCHLRAKWQEASDVLPQVIVLTTSTQVRAALGTREHVLQKPFHVREVLALIRRVIPGASRSTESSSHEAYTPDP